MAHNHPDTSREGVVNYFDNKLIFSCPCRNDCKGISLNYKVTTINYSYQAQLTLAYPKY